MKFYVCAHCGNIIAYAEDKGVPVVCCGDVMQELVPNTVDAAAEKHVPVIEQSGNVVTVKIGSTAHPMLPEHHIGWVALESKQGNQRKTLAIGSEPTVCFALCEGDEVVAAYAWCNLHGLWKA
ncbi:MAG: desulfoferrodoxin family protein [Candidatus Pelethousia sp.]|nr:desulfoferrodoxin family protein [Candidatus Pelethousia sp.]